MGKSYFIIALICLFCHINGKGQTQVSFQKAYAESGGSGEFVIQTADKGYVIGGVLLDNGAGGSDLCLIRTDANGKASWIKSYGGQYTETLKSVQQTADGGFILLGSTSSFVSGSPGSSNQDVYVVKTDANGNLSWSKTFGGPDVDIGNAIDQASDGGYIITGSTRSFGAGSRDVYIIKLDAAGATSWKKTCGGSRDDEGNAVLQASDGGYVITGSTSSFSTVGNGDPDVLMLKLDANGSLQWSKTFGNGAPIDIGHDIKQTRDGGYIIVGWTFSFRFGTTENHSNVYLIKTDNSGNNIFSRVYGGTATTTNNGYDFGLSVQPVSDGYLIAGRTSSFALSEERNYLIRVDNNGALVFSKLYGEEAGAGRHVAFKASKILIAGNAAVSGSGKIVFIKTNEDGTGGCGDSNPETQTASANTTTRSISPVLSVENSTRDNPATVVTNQIALTKTICCTIQPGITSTAPDCNTGCVTMKATAGTRFLWSTGETTQTIRACTPGTYTVRVTDVNGCTGTATKEFTPPSTCTVPASLSTTNISATAARLNWQTLPCATGYNVHYRRVGDRSFQSRDVFGNIGFLDISGLSFPSVQYEWKVRTKCAGSVASVFSSTVTFATPSQ